MSERIKNMGLKHEYVLEDLPEGFEWNEGELYYSLSRDEYMK